MTLRAMVMIGGLVTLAPAFAQEDIKVAPIRLSLTVRSEPPDELCRRIETRETSRLAALSLHRTFHDDFDEHPLSKGRWVPHYAGGAAWPDARYWGGDGSDFKRKTSAGTASSRSMSIRATAAGRRRRSGSIRSRCAMAFSRSSQRRTPPELKAVLFNNEYISGILTTQSPFSQKYGYFEIRAKMPVGRRRLAGVLDARR